MDQSIVLSKSRSQFIGSNLYKELFIVEVL